MDYAQASDEALVSLVCERDERALERLYDRYGRAAYSLMCRMLRDEGRAEELTQEVFLKLWRRPMSFESKRGVFSTWLLSVAHHRAIDELRSRRLEILPLGDLEASGNGLVDETPDAAETAAIRELRTTVRAALVELPAAQRHAIELSYFGGLSQREIADRLGEPLGTIKTRMRLAAQKLRSALAAPAGTWPNGRNGAHPTAPAVESIRAEL